MDLKQYINEALKIDVEMIKEDSLIFKIESSAEFIPDFIKECPVKITSISARKPTLEDVFLSLTGREIRDDKAEKNSALKPAMMMRRLR